MRRKYDNAINKINSTYSLIERESNSPKEFATNVQKYKVIPPLIFLMKKQNISSVETLIYTNFKDIQVQKWILEACNKFDL